MQDQLISARIVGQAGKFVEILGTWRAGAIEPFPRALGCPVQIYACIFGIACGRPWPLISGVVQPRSPIDIDPDYSFRRCDQSIEAQGSGRQLPC